LQHNQIGALGRMMGWFVLVLVAHQGMN
jgi:hypothetical protein